MKIEINRLFVVIILAIISYNGIAGCADERVSDKAIQSVELGNNQNILDKIKSLKPGGVLSLEDGEYKNVKLIVSASGTESLPIVIEAKNPGKVIFSGDAKVELRGDYITLKGISFKDGNRNPNEWKSHGPGLVAIYGSHSRVTECAFHAFDQANSAYITTSVDEYGKFAKYCRIDHCSFTEKITFDQVINLNNTPKADKTPGAKSAEGMYHRIDHCLFSNPRKPGNAGGGIRVGYWRKDFGRCQIDSCLFVRQDSEPEIVTSKSQENVYYANTILNCQGTLNFRHGDNQVAINNFFIGDDEMYDYGGMFVWGSGHLIASNYFQLSTTLKTRGNAALYLNPGAEGVEHALAFNLDIINNVFSNNKGYAIHFSPLKERRIEYCSAKGYEFKSPYNLNFSGNIFHSTSNEYQLFFDEFSQDNREIEWANNYSSTRNFGLEGIDGVQFVSPSVLVHDGMDQVNPAIEYPIYASTQIKRIEGIDLDLEKLANQGIKGKPLTVDDVGPKWLSQIPGSYFYTGKLSPEIQQKFDQVISGRSSD